MKNTESLLKEKKYNLIHVFYYVKENETKNNGEFNYSSYIENALSDYDLSKIDVVQEILDDMYVMSNWLISSAFQNALFEILARGNANGIIMEKTYIHKDYNRFLKGGKFS